MAKKHDWEILVSKVLKKRFYSNCPKRLTKCQKNTFQVMTTMVVNNLCEVSCHSHLYEMGKYTTCLVRLTVMDRQTDRWCEKYHITWGWGHKNLNTLNIFKGQLCDWQTLKYRLS